MAFKACGAKAVGGEDIIDASVGAFNAGVKRFETAFSGFRRDGFDKSNNSPRFLSVNALNMRARRFVVRFPGAPDRFGPIAHNFTMLLCVFRP